MKQSLISLLTIILIMQISSCTLYSVTSNYTITYQRTFDQLAYITYQQYSYQKGWNYLHVYANQHKSLIDQHRGAGFLQGYATYRDIYSAYKNLCGSIIKGQQLSVQTQNYIDQQLEYIQTMIQNHKRDIYWQYANVYLEQLRYMYRGYLTRINVEKTLYMYIGFSQFYYLTNVGDLEDLIPAFHDREQMKSHLQQSTQQQNKINILNIEGQRQGQGQQTKTKQIKQQNTFKPGNCNAYVKAINNKLYIGHSTHNIYQFMLRIFKTYHFPTRDQNVGSQWFSFSSRPGDLISKDDFYVLSSGLIIMQTSFSNQNVQNYKDLNPRTVPCWLRATIAVNLARNGKEWIDYFLKSRSGTHNNQWVVVDPAKMSTFKDIVTFVEQGFSTYQVVDMTPLLLQKGYVGSYNVPYTQKIYKKLGYQSYPYTYEDDPRASQFAKYDKLIKTVQDMKKYLITNQNQDPKVGLAPRYDLAAKNPSPFGLTDCKIVTPQTLQNGYIWAISGPSTSNGRFEPFDWFNWNNTVHQGMPRRWNFQWQQYKILNQQSMDSTNEKLKESEQHHVEIM